MDFWDLTALIFRRWRIALPLLLLAIGGTTYVALTAKPDFTMTAYVQFVPAKVAPNDAINPAGAQARNPWNQLGLNTLGQASVYATQDQKFLDLLKDEDHTDNFTLTMTYPSPIVTVEVVGATEKDARTTTELVINRLRDSAAQLQRGSGVGTADIITTQRLDQGQNVLPSRSKVKRAILAVAAAGLVLTAGGAVGYDAMMRRRLRKRRKRAADAELAKTGPDDTGTPGAEPEQAPADAVPTTPAKAAAAAAVAVPAVAAVKAPAESSVQTLPPAALERTAIVVKRPSKVPHMPSVAKPPRSPEAVTYKSMNAQDETNDHDPAPVGVNGDSAAGSSDVRVVLQPKWLGGEDGGKSH